MSKAARALKVEVLIGAMGAVLTLGAMAAVVLHLHGQGNSPILPIVGVFFIAILIGELFQVTLLDNRHTAPLATAASLAFAMTVDCDGGMSADYQGFTVVAVAAVAMAVGLIPNLVRGRRVPLPDLANRLIGLAVAAALFRELPVWQGRTVLELHASWPGYELALVMVMVSALALTVEVCLASAVRAARSHARVLRTLEDELRAAFGLNAALSATGALVALAERPLGAMAIPLFLFPLVLTQFAVRQQGAIRLTYRQTIRTLSSLTDVGGYTSSGHASRVAALSMDVGHNLGMSERDLLNLEYAALLHDIGQVALVEPIPGGATVLAAPADQRRIAHDGAEIVRQTGVLDNVAVILEAQTTQYRQVREFGENLPLSSRIIKVCNAYDDLAGLAPDRAVCDTAIERINLGLGYEYDPRVVDALIEVLSRGFLAGHRSG